MSLAFYSFISSITSTFSPPRSFLWPHEATSLHGFAGGPRAAPAVVWAWPILPGSHPCLTTLPRMALLMKRSLRVWKNISTVPGGRGFYSVPNDKLSCLFLGHSLDIHTENQLHMAEAFFGTTVVFFFLTHLGAKTQKSSHLF